MLDLTRRQAIAGASALLASCAAGPLVPAAAPDFVRREGMHLIRGGRPYVIEKRYVRQPEDEAGNYRTPALPGLILHVPMLWQDPLPDLLVTADSIKAMLGA